MWFCEIPDLSFIISVSHTQHIMKITVGLMALSSILLLLPGYVHGSEFDGDSSSSRVVFTDSGQAEIKENSRPRRFRFSEPSRWYYFPKSEAQKLYCRAQVQVQVRSRSGPGQVQVSSRSGSSEIDLSHTLFLVSTHPPTTNFFLGF